MCLILDANKYGDFMNKDNEDMKPVRMWIEGNGGKGKLVYSPTDKFEQELKCFRKMRDKLLYYQTRGKVKLVRKEKVEAEQAKLTGLKSNDRHVIALARVAKVDLLVSNDRDLHEDFKIFCNGRIYQNRSHRHLLTPDLCP